MLTEPTRNNYYYGKLLDVGHLQLEQDYGKQKRWLLNRLNLGAGVLCGLDVSVVDDKLRVGAGVAVDPLGREIVVPEAFTIDPFAPAPARHGPGIDPDQPGVATLWLCYRECLTDFGAALVSSCHGQERCEAGSIVESFSLHVAAGVPERPSSDLCDRLCAELTKGSDKDPVDLTRLLCELVPSGCPEPPAEDCVALVTVQVLEGRHLGDVDECAVRTRIYSQPVLMELITCLMTKVATCCQTTLRVDTVQMSTSAAAGPLLKDPGTPIQVPTSAKPTGFRVTFTKDPDQGTVTAFGAVPQSKASFLVRWLHDGKLQAVDGALEWETPRRVMWRIKNDAMPPGHYEVVLFGDASKTRTAIAELDGHRLDGDPIALPSGNDAEGGDFTFVIAVVVP